MYVNPFVAGIIATVLAELVALFVFCAFNQKK